MISIAILITGVTSLLVNLVNVLLGVRQWKSS